MKRSSSRVVYICNRKTNKEMFVSAMGGKPKGKEEKKPKPKPASIKLNLLSKV
jgi:hypothetical protein